jgi:alpha-glucuronidase
VLIREQGGVVTTLRVTGSAAQRIVGSAGAIWLMLTKTGTTYKAYYSGNGTVYKFLGSSTLDTKPNGVGLVTLSVIL